MDWGTKRLWLQEHPALDIRRTGDYYMIPQEMCTECCAVVSMIMALLEYQLA
jgi:hypothetical protein